VDWIKVAENRVHWLHFPIAVLSVGVDVVEELLRLADGLQKRLYSFCRESALQTGRRRRLQYRADTLPAAAYLHDDSSMSGS